MAQHLHAKPIAYSQITCAHLTLFSIRYKIDGQFLYPNLSKAVRNMGSRGVLEQGGSQINIPMLKSRNHRKQS